jgi:hypothetical protein
MARIIALAHARRSKALFEALRSAIVCGCAIALIAAGSSLPADALIAFGGFWL